MNSKFSYSGSSPVERVAEAAPTEETREQRVADRNAERQRNPEISQTEDQKSY